MFTRTGIALIRIIPKHEPQVLNHGHIALPGRPVEESFRQRAGSEQVDPWPVKSSNVAAALVSLRCRGISLRGSVTHLSKTCEVIAGSNSPEDKFPDKVQYQTSCQGVCRERYHERVLRRQLAIVESLNRKASSYKKTSAFVQDDLLMEFHIQLSNKTLVQYYYATAAAFRGGIQKPVQSYFQLFQTDDFERTNQLVFQQKDHVRCVNLDKWHAPISSAYETESGSLSSLSTVQLAAQIVKLEVDSGGLPGTISIHKRKFDDVSLTVLKLKGLCDDEWAPIKIDSTGATNMKPVPRAKANAKPEGVDTRGNSSGSGLNLDMLDFFSDEQLNSCEPGAPLSLLGDDTATAAELREEVFTQLLDAVGGEDAGNEAATSKWKEDLEGLLDPDQVKLLEEVEKQFEETCFNHQMLWAPLCFFATCSFLLLVFPFRIPQKHAEPALPQGWRESIGGIRK